MILLDKIYWEVRNTKNKGRGLFAKKDIAKGTIIGDYLGKVIHPEEAMVDEENFYLMYYHDHAAIVPDLDKPGVHLLNHSCDPNSFLYIHKGHTLAFSLREIKKDEELTIDYLLAPIDEFCEPCLHVCACGFATCRGTMHLPKEKYNVWRSLTESQAKETKRERIRYGKNLPKLTSYPDKIPANYIKSVQQLYVEY